MFRGVRNIGLAHSDRPIGLEHAYRSGVKKSLGLIVTLYGSMYHQTFFNPSLCLIIKRNRRGYFDTRGWGRGSDYRRGGVLNGGGGAGADLGILRGGFWAGILQGGVKVQVRGNFHILTSKKKKPGGGLTP